ncbi:MAG: lipopolysaccharide kinase InaA family protein [Planctomycetota bacterium]
MVVPGRGCTAATSAEHADAVRALVEAGEPSAWPDFAAIKGSTVRTVLRGRGPGDLDLYVKVYRAVRWTDHARDALRGSRARVEYDNLSRARRLGLPAVEPIAHGASTAVVGNSFLVTRAVDGSPLPRGAWPLATAQAVGHLLRRTHDAGLAAFDLHAENIVADTGGGLWLVDLTSARFGESLDLTARARGLAFVALELDGGPRHAAMAPLLSAYGASSELRDAAAATWRRLRRQALAAFGRRAGRACRHTSVAVVRGARTFRHRPAAALADAAVACEPTLAESAAAKSGRRGAVWLLDHLVAKRRPRAAARRLFRAGYWLTYAGVPTPMPVALVLRPGYGTAFAERVAGIDLAKSAAGGKLTAAVAAAAARALGAAVGRLHAHDLRNRDLKFENLVLEDGTGRVLMVDLDGVSRRGAGDGRAQAADLGRLLAAFASAGAPGGVRALRAFVRAYYRARQCLEHRRPALRTQRFQRRRIVENARRRGAPAPSTPSASA